MIVSSLVMAIAGIFIAESYILPSDLTPPAWIIVETENPSCARSVEGWLSRSFAIPPDGYLCTSNQTATSVLLRRFYARRPDGTLAKLSEDEEIHSASGIELSGTCEVSAYSFFFGSKEMMTTEEGRADRLYDLHPECRGSLTPRLGPEP